jgi:hypothetical protein
LFITTARSRSTAPTPSSEANSKLTTQQLVWHFLPMWLKDLNGKRTRKERSIGLDVNYSPADGFADRVLSIGYGVQANFILYSNDPANFEGVEYGDKDVRDACWWMDESLTLPWFQLLQRRSRYRPGYGLWSFTPIGGITATIKDAVGNGKVRIARRASLLPSNRILIPGLKAGHVPLLQDGTDPGTKIVYFHSDLTPFGSGGKPYRETVAADCAGRSQEHTLRVFYGYTRDVAGRAYPKYNRQVHSVAVENLPWERTNYVFIDPAAGRNWFLIWVGVPPGNPRRIYVYRDWPDRHRFGEWAVPSTRKSATDSKAGKDGDPGPAQTNQGWGVSRFKRCFLQEETIGLALLENGRWKEPDPHRRHVASNALRAAGLSPVRTEKLTTGMEECFWSPKLAAEFLDMNPEPIREEVRMRFIDPRAASNPLAAEKGGTNLIELFHAEQRTGNTVEGPRMPIVPAYSGRGIDDGMNHVNNLLDYREDEPLCPVMNEPRLYVAECCEQVDWAMQNYTGEGGESGACKDPADLIRYAAQCEDLRFVRPGAGRSIGGGSY